MMAKYNVTIPFAGAFFIEVEAADEAKAVEDAYEYCTLGTPDLSGPLTDVEWDTYPIIAEGNCLHAQYNKIEVEVKDE